MNSFRLLGFKRKLEVLDFVEGFFELHPPAGRTDSRATEGKQDKNRVKNSYFCLSAERF